MAVFIFLCQFQIVMPAFDAEITDLGFDPYRFIESQLDDFLYGGQVFTETELGF